MNINKIDPKQRLANKNSLLNKIAWILVVFFSLISAYIIYQTSHYSASSASNFSGKYMIVLVSLLFAALGNLMNNIKPNYFVGIRTPWNLENEDNWRKTHHLGSKIWFFGGLAMALFALLLPESASSYIIIIGIIPLTVIPIGYSYSIFRKQKTKA